MEMTVLAPWVLIRDAVAIKGRTGGAVLMKLPTKLFQAIVSRVWDGEIR
jgi:hypothetical protein